MPVFLSFPFSSLCWLSFSSSAIFMSNTVFQELGREVLSMAGGLVSSLKAQASAEKEKRVNVTADKNNKQTKDTFACCFPWFLLLVLCSLRLRLGWCLSVLGKTNQHKGGWILTNQPKLPPRAPHLRPLLPSGTKEEEQRVACHGESRGKKTIFQQGRNLRGRKRELQYNSTIEAKDLFFSPPDLQCSNFTLGGPLNLKDTIVRSHMASLSICLPCLVTGVCMGGLYGVRGVRCGRRRRGEEGRGSQPASLPAQRREAEEEQAPFEASRVQARYISGASGRGGRVDERETSSSSLTGPSLPPIHLSRGKSFRGPLALVPGLLSCALSLSSPLHLSSLLLLDESPAFFFFFFFRSPRGGGPKRTREREKGKG
ncbi:hypothetical protein BDP67DRAFT_70407 [Colletotrichum lupini]|nr:hypothetical protein BDP67DRAFT_70407 [Colletotrichum lupini]